MTFRLADRVKETTLTGGTGPMTLGGAQTGYQSFASVMALYDTTNYTIYDPTSGAWEVGEGSYGLSNTLVRTLVLSSSSGGTGSSFVAFLPTAKDIFMDCPASVLLNAVNAVPQSGAGAAPVTVAGGITAAGTTQATATPLGSARCVVGTVPAGSGVILFTGPECVVLNRGLNNLNVYPPVGAQIEQIGTNLPGAVSPGTTTTFIQVSSTQWNAF